MYFELMREMPMAEKILVMDEQGKVLCCLSEILTGEGYAVVTADNVNDGFHLMQVEAPDLVMADIRMPIDRLIYKMHDNNRLDAATDVIVMAAEKERAAAVNWLGKGAYDFLLKPLKAPGLLTAVVGRALQKRRLVLENKRLAKQLEQATIKDSLTGIFNHRHLHQRLMDEIVRGSRYNRAFLLIVADIDGFGKVNETYGWHVGDLVLKRLAKLFEDNLRVSDSVFRCDGGKFVLLLPETRINQAVRLADRILEGVRYHDFGGHGSNPRVTISMGAAEFPMEALDAASLIKLADLRLQGVKIAGGDDFQFEDRTSLISG
jgi:diguanylate cyclase (GGDEF)-like protein